MKDIRNEVVKRIESILDDNGVKLTTLLSDETILLECGLDSLGFAILVVDLEDILGYDPFVLMDEPFYPRTLEEFVGIYVKFKPQG